VTYSADVLVFVAITLVLALIWGYLRQKTGWLWLLRRRTFASLCALLLFFCELAIKLKIPQPRQTNGANL
jgi:hypothetical protein